MLEVIRIYLNNSLENYNYLVVDRTLNQAVAIDPFDVTLLKQSLDEQKLQLIAIFITHEHQDHYYGAKPLSELTDAPIYACYLNQRRLPKIDYLVKDGDRIKLSDNLIFDVIETPGHIKGHIVFYMPEKEKPILFSGDTLFNAGVGNIRHPSANIKDLYESVQKIRGLPKDTLLYPGHDYIQKNLEFSLSVEANNQDANQLLKLVNQQTSETREITNLEIEEQVNPFLRLNKIKGYHNYTPEAVFTLFRQLRDKF
ncbi:hydroxyacylglutathione hydrolase family protein [Thiotrichales bacterium 19S9-12]|nr:hydroxyacylglutathione hydrolase family protein [Thiotrichales bacterium 19S9-11]MCF6811339.1 hydroxyacylglutathione hydrolase family protein [Thiotrichales bacterium 19S9-12]